MKIPTHCFVCGNLLEEMYPNHPVLGYVWKCSPWTMQTRLPFETRDTKYPNNQSHYQLDRDVDMVNFSEKIMLSSNYLVEYFSNDPKNPGLDFTKISKLKWKIGFDEIYQHSGRVFDIIKQNKTFDKQIEEFLAFV